MNNHMSLRSSNPVLQSKKFKDNLITKTEGNMTIEGTVNKTGLALMLVIISAAYAWNNPVTQNWALPAAIVGFIIALVTVFKPTFSPVTVPIYSIVEGIFLGAISIFFNKQYPGIVVQAVFLTFGTLASMLVAYKSGLIKVTENFKLGVFAATGGIALLYLINFIMSIFGRSIGFITGNSWMGIGFSVFVVIIAALNLVMDFDFIEEAAEQGSPKYLEWYGAFGLMVTLIWLYLEILRLLAKIRR